MSLEVAGFTLVAALLVRRWPGFRFAAPLGVGWRARGFADHRACIFIPGLCRNRGAVDAPRALDAEWTSLVSAVLAVINVLLVAFYPKTDAWEKE